LQQVLYYLSHTSSPLAYVWNRVLLTFCQGWPGTTTYLYLPCSWDYRCVLGHSILIAFLKSSEPHFLSCKVTDSIGNGCSSAEPLVGALSVLGVHIFPCGATGVLRVVTFLSLDTETQLNDLILTLPFTVWDWMPPHLIFSSQVFSFVLLSYWWDFNNSKLIDLL
jgi:hypothetical protein